MISFSLLINSLRDTEDGTSVLYSQRSRRVRAGPVCNSILKTQNSSAPGLNPIKYPK